MEFEPEIPKPRDTEALLVVVDAYTTTSSVFNDLRDVAMRLARTRLIYGISKDDLIGVVVTGSSNTSNALSRDNPGGYEGIEVLVSPITRSLHAVKALSKLQQGTRRSNLLDILDVCGDCMSSMAALRSRKKRIILFTEGHAMISPQDASDISDFEDTCKLYREHEIQVDIIFHCSDDFSKVIEQFEEGFYDQDNSSVEFCIEKSEGFEKPFLLALTKATGGVLLPYETASPLAEMPVAKVKRASAKFRGVLNIADMLKIPVKRYSYASEASHPSGKKISWDTSCKRNKPVYVLTETQRVASTKDDSPLPPEEIVNAYPYGPELVPEQTEVDSYAWSIHLPRGLDVLGFVPQHSVPQSLFLGNVDVLIAMPGCDAATRLMSSLVMGMHAEKLGIIARSVTASNGAPPRLAYLWPRIELDEKKRSIRNCFLFQVNIPMREDIRDVPFSNFEDSLGQVSEAAHSGMDRYVEAAMLEEDMAAEDDEDEKEDAFWPSDYCNPNLDWFNICVVHRALAGISSIDFPPLSKWHREIIDPSSFILSRNRSAFNDAIRDLKNALPVLPVPKKVKKGRKVYQALQGEFASISDYLPEEENDEEEKDNGSGVHIVSSHHVDDFNDDLSEMSDIGIADVGDISPVSDFESLVKRNMFRFAAVSLLVVIRRLIREAEDDKALRCLQSLRRTSIEQKESQFFNDFIASLLQRCGRHDVVGNRTAAFFRHVGRYGEISSTLDVISMVKPRAGENDQGYYEHQKLLAEVAEQIRDISSEKKGAPSVSNISGV